VPPLVRRRGLGRRGPWRGQELRPARRAREPPRGPWTCAGLERAYTTRCASHVSRQEPNPAPAGLSPGEPAALLEIRTPICVLAGGPRQSLCRWSAVNRRSTGAGAPRRPGHAIIGPN